MKILKASLMIDGIKTALLEDEITLSTNSVDLDGEGIEESSATLSVYPQAIRDPEIRTIGNASVS